MLTVGLALAVLALVLLALARQGLRRAGLPDGRVLYEDVGMRRTLSEPLYDPALGLAGRPDYLVEQGRALIPVEVKSGRTPTAPYENHRWQALAYCLLVEQVLHRPAPYALIRYPHATYQVAFTPEAKTALLDLLAEMRRAEMNQRFDRSHQDPTRCRGCGFRDLCDQRLE
ncbi:MAG TPA: Dna2/Cas4 domain-containing protein [Anaerolineae bacterium]|nr:Dna2/Cas4 domain-containing protein [Anaerolineae bacterium]HID84448.1 Dna2/Cas4 domain-containing protein [Anaerolineales bacterium]HIQ09656.1 Dna2/Cas4 domain-containing protein [Anaerolineaceae bacterium]